MKEDPLSADRRTHDFPHPPLGWSLRERLGLTGLLLLALGLRLWNVQAMGANPRYEAPVMDAAYHLEWARAILGGQDYPSGAYFRAPLYPWFLAGGLKLFGGSLLAVRVVQCLLGVATTMGTLLLARRMFGRAAGWVAGVLAASNWVLVYFDGELLIPTLYVPLLLFGLLAALALPKRNFASNACLLAGIAFGLAAIARPNVLLYMPLLFGWVLWKAPSRKLWRGVMLTIGTLLPIVPITVRNYVKSGEFVLIATQAGVNLWIGNNPVSDGMTAIVPGTRGGWWEGYHDSRRLAELDAGRALSDSEVSAYYTSKAWTFLREHPGTALRQFVWKLRLFFMNWELSNNQEIRFTSRHFHPPSRFSVSLGAIFGLALVGLVRLGVRRASELLPVTGFLLVYTLSVVCFFVCSRYRVPVLPVLMVFAGHGAVGLFGWARARNWQPFVAGTAVFGLVWWGSNRLPDKLLTGDSLGLLSLGSMALERGDLDEAERYLEMALEDSTGNRQLHLVWGQLLQRRGQLDSARRFWYESLERYPDYIELRQSLSDLEYDLGNHWEALKLAQTGLRLAPGQVDLIYSCGRALYGLDRKAEALEQFDRVLRLDPESFQALFSKGIVLMELGQRQAAHAALLAAKEHSRGLPTERIAELDKWLESSQP